MSSNMRLQKVCKHCGVTFVAKTTVTQFCSDGCAKRNYKQRNRTNKIEKAKEQTRAERSIQILSNRPSMPIQTTPAAVATIGEKALLDVQELSIIIGLSERTIYRLLKDPIFPRLNIGKRNLFNKEKVLQYLNHKFANQ